MAIRNKQIEVGPFERGFHLITDDIRSALHPLPERALLHLFIQHTSAGICINENADPSVRRDFNSFFDYLVPEGKEFVTHTTEGPDDMPAHVKSVLSGSGISIPIEAGSLHLGTWQGIYLCEFRNRPRPRKILATLIGD